MLSFLDAAVEVAGWTTLGYVIYKGARLYIDDLRAELRSEAAAKKRALNGPK